MRSYSLINRTNKKCSILITFYNEIEEQTFLKDLIFYFEKVLPINCMLTELDTSYCLYEKYFPRGNYYVFDQLTRSTIFAFQLNCSEVLDVISNWGYYTFDAKLCFGTIEMPDLNNTNYDYSSKLEAMPIVISQILDYSLGISFDDCYYKKMSDFLSKYQINLNFSM